MTTALQIWTEPVPMDTGAPVPTTLVDGHTLWVAYLAFDPEFPGWGHPDTERLHEHPLWGKGLEHYEFHRFEADSGPVRWIVTFHDETLDVTASTATASTLIFAANHLEAIATVRKRT